MLIRVLLIAISVILLVLSACTSEPPSTLDTQLVVSPDDIAAYAQLADDETLTLGQQIYETNCASCHGVNGEGQFPNAPMQPDATGRIGAPPHNSNGHTWHHDDDMLYRIVNNGGMGTQDRFYPMPALGEQLSDDEIVAVISYIKTMWTEEERRIQAERTLLVRSQNQ